MRLDKYVSQSKAQPRKLSRTAIKAGLVSVNGIIERNPARHLSSDDEITLATETLNAPQPRYIMLYKPKDVICATSDSMHTCVIDLLEEATAGLNIAGRLDKDSTGLVLLSDDGQWLHRVTSPNHACRKTYVVELDEAVSNDTFEQFSNGILLKGENKKTRPAQIEPINEKRVKVTITEGRYHQIKRMFTACGYFVRDLHRQQIGEIVLDDALGSGQSRHLTQAEIDSVTSNA